MKPHEDEAAVQAEDAAPETVATIGVVNLAGRASLLEMIRYALEATGATGVGRILRLDDDDA